IVNKIDAGACVTASHNPREYNGLKLFFGQFSIGGENIQEVRKICESGKFATGNGVVEKRDALPSYFQYLHSSFKLDKKLKVVIDAGNGMAALTAPKIFRDLGCEVVELYCDVDGTFPNHVPDPSVNDALKELVVKVKETHADVGVAFDGDGDRIGVVDEKGNIFKGDQLLAIFVRSTVIKHEGKIVFDVTCSLALEEDIASHGGTPIRWKTGHTNIELKLEEEKALLGGEMSGHIFFKENYYVDDAVYAACKFAELLSNSKTPASHLLDGYPHYVNSPKIYIDTTDDAKWKIVDGVKKELQQMKCKVNDIDGVMAVFPNGWGLLRASNTMPAIVVRFEAKTQRDLDEIKNIFVIALEKHGVKIP
ncbi:MAG: phosphomannomutase/phosphoglucomutase, partial [Candidatus Micrarchaeota archaeon]